MPITRNFKLFLNAGHTSPLVIFVNQYDRGEQWVFTLYNNDGTQYVPSTGAIVGIKSDGLGIINTGSVVDGKVVINETEQMTAASGKAVFELMIDSQTHGTANFVVLVEPKPGDSASLSESDLSLLQEAIDSTSPTAIAEGVSDWMDEHLTPTTPVVDDTLTVQGAAADAKVTGDKITALKATTDNLAKEEDLSSLSLDNIGKYVKADDTIGTSALLSHTDYILIPTSAIAVECGNQTSNSGGTTYRCNPNIVFYDENKTKIMANSNSSDNVARYNIPTGSKYIRVNQPAPSAPVKTSLIRFVIPDTNGFVGKHKATFTSTATPVRTWVYLEANTPYTIVCNTGITGGHVNVYIDEHSSLFRSIYKKGSIEFTPANSGYMVLYNVDGIVTGAFEVEVYKSSDLLAKLRREPTVYEVGALKAYTSLTALLLALKDDNSEKIIYVDGGDYNIFQEYTDLGLLAGDPPSDPSLDYFDYNVWIPTNTHIIGRGLVRLLWQPTSSQISQGWSKTISPVNVAGSMTLENVEIYCGNGRYCIHDDPLGKLEYKGAIKRYKNVRCYKTAKDDGYGFTSVIGFGLDTNMTYQFDDCLFKSEIAGNCFYMHNRTLEPNAYSSSPTVVVNSCVMDTSGSGQGVSLGNGASASGKNIHIRATFTDCYIKGSFKIGDEANKSQGTVPNTWDVTLVNCNAVNVEIASVTNPYPAKIYFSGGGGGGGGDVTSVNGKTGAVVLNASDVGAVSTETDPTVPSWAKQPSKPTYTASEVGALPSNTSIPSKTSDLTNDSGFVASSSLASVATSGSYNDLSNKPTIPTVPSTDSTITAGGTNPVNSVAVIAYINSLDATNTSY